MARRKSGPQGHTGRTAGGNTRDQKIERIGPVTVYKRGQTYYLYYREQARTERRRIEGNLAVAKATAAKVAAALTEHRPSPLGFQRTSPSAMAEGYLDYVGAVQKLAWRTRDRYRAALDRFLAFCEAADVTVVDGFDERHVEDFVRWLRGQNRTRNGAKNGRKEQYKVGGVRFILCTCRTAFNWAGRRRMLPPYSENPFSRFPIDQLRDADEEDQGPRVFTPDQERSFFAACSEWQRNLFLPLATYGLRVGELTHLLVEDVDFGNGTIHIRSKPELFWRVKTARRRQIPLTGDVRSPLGRLIGGRKAGFVFLNEPFVTGGARLPMQSGSPKALRQHLEAIAAAVLADNPDAAERDQRRVVVAFCRSIGQIPEKRVRGEFIKLTEQIGCPEFTRAHDLRHLFSSRAQERGLNPLLVQEILGHTTLEMTRKYTHLGMETKRAAIEQLTGTASPEPGDH